MKNVQYEIENGKIVIGKKTISPKLMKIYGILIKFFSGVLIANSLMGIFIYGSIYSILFLLAGICIFGIGVLYKGVAIDAIHRIEQLNNGK